MSTRLQLQTRAALRLRDTNMVVFTSAYLQDMLNVAYEKVLSASPYWPFLDTMANTASQIVAASSNTITLPTDVWRVLSVNNDTDKYAMAEITGRKQFLALYPDPTASPGTPKHYRVFGNQLQVFPYAANATQLRIEYTVAPADLSSDSSVPVFPAAYHDLLVEYVLSLAYTDDGNLDMAKTHLSMFEDKLADMKTDLLGPRGDSYAQINDDLF